MPPAPADAGSSDLPRKRRSQTPDGDDESQMRKQKAKRTTLACERCRLKKLRCIGGHPCSACQRAKSDCSFGDREQGISLTNQRLDQLERTIAELVASLNSRPPIPVSTGSDGLTQPSGPPQDQHQLIVGSSVNAKGPQYHSVTLERDDVAPCLGTPPLSDRHPNTATGPVLSFSPQASVSPLTQSHATYSARVSGPTRTSPDDPRASEKLESRWAALQQNSAPFPPLMAHPTVWSGESAKTSPDGRGGNVHPALGLTHYKAHVHLQSEPVSEGIVGELAARTLFTLFYQKCHPSFPLLEPCTDFDSHFDHIRSSAPFLFTTILAIAGRYYTGYRKTQSALMNLPPIAPSALESLADLACAHLGFVLFRKQHQLSDVQATLFLSVWIPRGKAQSADQWMLTGLCTRLAYRIGIPDVWNHPGILRLLNSASPDANDVHDVNSILPHWHTWLMISQFDICLSLGFGRPHPMPFTDAAPRQYLAVVRRLASSARVDLAAAAYATSLFELSVITNDLISGLRSAHLQSGPRQGDSQSAARAWTDISTLLSELNPRLDQWQRQWTWGGSYDAIALGDNLKTVMIYGHHAQLCLNSLSMNLIAADANGDNQQVHDPEPYLTKAFTAAVSIVQTYIESSGTEPIVRYGADYLVLILGQAAVFFIRAFTTRLGQSLPMDQLVLLHHLKTAIEILESNNLSTTNICGWVAQLCRDLAQYTGFSLNNGSEPINDGSSAMPNQNAPEPEWDVSAFLGQNVAAGEIGMDTAGYFDFAQSLFPPPL
ncbi:putative C6 finger domain protein [Fusarium sp. MPI-SDFR-AT-0072]|nr:putative C6 finger domain protein [Fusarium sp. MPI-SDFR-AT-0072]